MSSDSNKTLPSSLHGWDAPAKNSSTAKNRQKFPSLLNDKLLRSSGLVATSPLYYDWQSNKPCVSERLRSLFANTTLADVYFNIKQQSEISTNFKIRTSKAAIIDESSCVSCEISPPGCVQRIPAHSFVLAISSAVFEAMFYGPMSSNNQRQTLLAHQHSWPSIFDTAQIFDGSGDQLMQTEASPENEELCKKSMYHPGGPSSSQAPSSNVPIEIHLHDVNPVAFLNVLRFIYTDEILLDPGNVLQTLYIAKKYAITMVERACVDFLAQAITIDNAFMLLTQANFFDEHELSQKCFEVIDKNTAKAFDSDEFLAIDETLLCSVLDRDTLCIREVRLFTSVLKWARAEYRRQNPERVPPTTELHRPSSPVLPSSEPPRPASNPPPPSHKDFAPMGVEELRGVLQSVLPHIRFPQMSIEEFAEVVVPSGVLEDSKVVKLFLWFISSHNKPEIPYCAKPRCFLHGVEEIVRRFGAVDQRWDYRGTSDRIRFMVDRKIYVVGFGLYGSIHGQSDYEASIEITIDGKCKTDLQLQLLNQSTYQQIEEQIVHPESGVVLGSNDVNYLADGSPNIFRVAFKEPIPLTPHVNYLASATIKGLDTYYGTRGLREIEHECSSSSAGKVTFRFSYAACNNNGTSVEDGQIPEIIFFI